MVESCLSSKFKMLKMEHDDCRINATVGKKIMSSKIPILSLYIRCNSYLHTNYKNLDPKCDLRTVFVTSTVTNCFIIISYQINESKVFNILLYKSVYLVLIEK